MAQSSLTKHKLRTVVIDAGHGGKDPGAIGKISKEKEITLAVALALGHKITEELKDVKVIYTRDDDNFVELFERANIANKHKADMFISIHINSSRSKEAHGAEAWVLGLHKSDENLEVSKRENAVIQLEGNVEQNYGFDPNSPAGNIMMTMQQSAFLNHSILFAKNVESEFSEKTNRKNRGVHQAGFVVLYKTVMPSCLIELGFISNREEEKYLNSDEGQDEISNSIFIAFKKFKQDYEGQIPQNKNEDNDDEKKQIAPKKLIKIQEHEEDKSISEQKNKLMVISSGSEKPKIEKRNEPIKKEENQNVDIPIIEKQKEPAKPKQNSHQEEKSDNIAWNENYVKIEEKKAETKIEKSKELMSNNSKGTKSRIYRVQIMARPEAVPPTHPIFGLYDDVEEIKEDNVFKYLCGKFENLDDALIRKIELKKRGYGDVFIAVYEGSKRIGMKF